jgi:hypothetical protein
LKENLVFDFRQSILDGMTETKLENKNGKWKKNWKKV